jgi:tripartite-type tricarboxylate transporter receptor subunit TctC
MTHIRKCLTCGVAAAACLLAPLAFGQQTYPGKIVRFVVTYPPGGSSDVMARVIAHQLTEYWGQQFVITATRSCWAISVPFSRRGCFRR